MSNPVLKKSPFIPPQNARKVESKDNEFDVIKEQDGEDRVELKIDEISLFPPAKPQTQIEMIFKSISTYAKQLFILILNINQDTIGEGTLVLGDADGSIGRILLIALQSGHISLEAEGLNQLSFILNQEASIIKEFNEGKEDESVYIKRFQENRSISKAIEIIFQNIDYKKSDTKLIFIGDILYDRFSCHIPAMLSLIENLHQNGAIFIQGNHDSIQTKNEVSKTKSEYGWQYASSACVQSEFSEEELITFEKVHFVRAYFDEKNSQVYSHYGWYFENELYYTAFDDGKGFEQISSLQDLVDAMNKASPVSNPFLTPFRYEDEKVDLGPISNKLAINKPVSIHGHNGIYGEKLGVHGDIINVNAKEPRYGSFLAVATIVPAIVSQQDLNP